MSTYRCTSLIAYGSLAPGGSDHHRLQHLKGEWIKGWIRATPAERIEDYRFDSQGEVTEAWVIEFLEKPQYLPETENTARALRAWTRNAWDEWEKLDSIFGQRMTRTSDRFWPDGADVDSTGSPMIVVNVYMNSDAHVLGHLKDEVHPDNNDTMTQWHEVVNGQKNYDPGIFMGMINDLAPDDFDAFFNLLPNSDGFVNRLHRLFQDHTVNKHPSEAGGNSFYIYFYPLAQNKVNDEEMLRLAKQQVEMQIDAVLRLEPGTCGYLRDRDAEIVTDGHVQTLQNLVYQITEDDDSAPENDEVGEIFRDDFIDNITRYQTKDNWLYCLGEACYSIANSYELQEWLMQDWFVTDTDLEPLYEFWRAGGRLTIDEGKCFVRVSRRD